MSNFNSYKDKAKFVDYGPLGFSTQGEFKMGLALDGEKVEYIELEFGYKHFGIEKIIEKNSLYENLLLIQRAGGALSFCYALTFLRGLEKITHTTPTEKDECLRAIMCEGERIVSHVVNIAKIIKLTGVDFVFFDALHFRNNFFKVYQKLFGKRVFPNFLIWGGEQFDILPENLNAFFTFLKQVEDVITKINVVMSNIFLKKRTVGVGVISKDLAINYSLSGPNARASGVDYDVRKINKGSIYNKIQFQIPTATAGDVYSRCCVRIDEIRQSLNIIQQLIVLFTSWDEEKKLQTKIEQRIDYNLIDSCKYALAQHYEAEESPRGELGFYFVTNATNRLYRCKINGASMNAVQIIEEICQDTMFADVGVIIKSLDLLISEVDR
jgi:NADH-quinone oxidoreductase subunit D